MLQIIHIQNIVLIQSSKTNKTKIFWKRTVTEYEKSMPYILLRVLIKNGNTTNLKKQQSSYLSIIFLYKRFFKGKKWLLLKTYEGIWVKVAKPVFEATSLRMHWNWASKNSKVVSSESPSFSSKDIKALWMSFSLFCKRTIEISC